MHLQFCYLQQIIKQQVQITMKQHSKRESGHHRSHKSKKHKSRRTSRSSYCKNHRIEKSRYHKRNSSYRHQNEKKRKRHYSSSSSSSSSNSSQAMKSSSSGSTAHRRRAPHFRFKVGQKIGHKYRIQKLLGDGTFGRVVEGSHHDRTYAIKIIKPVDRYVQSAKIQRSIVKHINDRDPNDAHGIVRYIESFYHHKHFCLVFKPLGKSLYDVIKMNEYIGFPMAMVQQFFKQILNSISFLHRIGYTHTDLKPENILLEKEELLKTEHPKKIDIPRYIPISDRIRIIDFGGATKHDDHHSSIINTRQYRAPEVILECCKWNEISDVWSIGCIIIELLTGELLFETHADPEHLYMIQKNSGYFPHWMISKSQQHKLKKLFLDGRIDKELLDKQLENWDHIKAMKTVPQICQGNPQLIDLLMKCLQIDPNKRITCAAALNHSYFQVKY